MKSHEEFQRKIYFGVSPKIERVRMEINVAVPVNCSVLLLGETGTGKGMIARMIHENGPRRDGAFVGFNCSALSGDLLKSELFGHAEGSFTGATRDRMGLIEVANGGTLFLDELGDMPKDVQSLLLKVIEEKTFRRVGENRVRSSNFRLICATNRRLSSEVRRGVFRADLYYRVNTLEISVPPLRECVEDIPGLADHILKNMGYDRFPVSNDVIGALVDRRWPGNIRELKNALERALVFARGEAIAPEHLMPDISGYDDGRRPDPFIAQMEMMRDVWNLDDLEKMHIRRALAHFGGDKIRTSAALGISTASLYRKLSLMGEMGANAGVGS